MSMDPDATNDPQHASNDGPAAQDPEADMPTLDDTDMPEAGVPYHAMDSHEVDTGALADALDSEDVGADDLDADSLLADDLPAFPPPETSLAQGMETYGTDYPPPSDGGEAWEATAIPLSDDEALSFPSLGEDTGLGMGHDSFMAGLPPMPTSPEPALIEEEPADDSDDGFMFESAVDLTNATTPPQENDVEPPPPPDQMAASRTLFPNRPSSWEIAKDEIEDGDEHNDAAGSDSFDGFFEAAPAGVPDNGNLKSQAENALKQLAEALVPVGEDGDVLQPFFAQPVDDEGHLPDSLAFRAAARKFAICAKECFADWRITPDPNVARALDRLFGGGRQVSVVGICDDLTAVAKHMTERNPGELFKFRGYRFLEEARGALAHTQPEKLLPMIRQVESRVEQEIIQGPLHTALGDLNTRYAQICFNVVNEYAAEMAAPSDRESAKTVLPNLAQALKRIRDLQAERPSDGLIQAHETISAKVREYLAILTPDLRDSRKSEKPEVMLSALDHVDRLIEWFPAETPLTVLKQQILDQLDRLRKLLRISEIRNRDEAQSLFATAMQGMEADIADALAGLLERVRMQLTGLTGEEAVIAKLRGGLAWTDIDKVEHLVELVKANVHDDLFHDPAVAEALSALEMHLAELIRKEQERLAELERDRQMHLAQDIVRKLEAALEGKRAEELELVTTLHDDVASRADEVDHPDAVGLIDEVQTQAAEQIRFLVGWRDAQQEANALMKTPHATPEACEETLAALTALRDRKMADFPDRAGRFHALVAPHLLALTTRADRLRRLAAIAADAQVQVPADFAVRDLLEAVNTLKRHEDRAARFREQEAQYLASFEGLADRDYLDGAGKQVVALRAALTDAVTPLTQGEKLLQPGISSTPQELARLKESAFAIAETVDALETLPGREHLVERLRTIVSRIEATLATRKRRKQRLFMGVAAAVILLAIGAYFTFRTPVAHFEGSYADLQAAVQAGLTAETPAAVKDAQDTLTIAMQDAEFGTQSERASFTEMQSQLDARLAFVTQIATELDRLQARLAAQRPELTDEQNALRLDLHAFRDGRALPQQVAMIDGMLQELERVRLTGRIQALPELGTAAATDALIAELQTWLSHNASSEKRAGISQGLSLARQWSEFRRAVELVIADHPLGDPPTATITAANAGTIAQTLHTAAQQRMTALASTQSRLETSGPTTPPGASYGEALAAYLTTAAYREAMLAQLVTALTTDTRETDTILAAVTELWAMRDAVEGRPHRAFLAPFDRVVTRRFERAQSGPEFGMTRAELQDMVTTALAGEDSTALANVAGLLQDASADSEWENAAARGMLPQWTEQVALRLNALDEARQRWSALSDRFDALSQTADTSPGSWRALWNDLLAFQRGEALPSQEAAVANAVEQSQRRFFLGAARAAQASTSLTDMTVLLQELEQYASTREADLQVAQARASVAQVVEYLFTLQRARDELAYAAKPADAIPASEARATAAAWAEEAGNQADAAQWSMAMLTHDAPTPPDGRAYTDDLADDLTALASRQRLAEEVLAAVLALEESPAAGQQAWATVQTSLEDPAIAPHADLATPFAHLFVVENPAPWPTDD